MDVISNYQTPEDVETRRRPGKRAIALLVGAIVIILVLLYLYQYISVLGLNYDIERCNSDIVELEQQQKKLSMAFLERKSRGQINEIARRDLGMIRPDEGQIIIIEESVDGTSK